jgi:hypothetical protein
MDYTAFPKPGQYIPFRVDEMTPLPMDCRVTK